VAETDGLAAMKAYRDDVRARMSGLGRDPDSCKVMYLVAPVIGATEAEAREKAEQQRLRDLEFAEVQLAMLSKVTNIDSIAAQMDEAMQHVGGDGFLFISDLNHRRFVSEVIDGLVPGLQRRGLSRTGYAYPMLRENLLEF
jgi:long-chain alkane monooxygenase